MCGLPPYQQEVEDLFASEWLRSRISQPDVHRTAQTLASSISHAKEPPPRTYIWSSILAIHRYASSNPEAIDFMVSVFAEVVQLLPETVTNEYGSGPDAGMEALRWWIIDEANCFNTVEPRNPTGTLDPNDRSNLLFKEADVNDQLDAVLDRIQEWRSERTKIIISMAIASRCFALNIVREDGGEHIAGIINGNLQRDMRWTKADFIASCLLLRGCAKSLIAILPAGQDALTQWKLDFKRFLLPDKTTGDNDFAVKYHAALVLKNLAFGPEDEVSGLLFAHKQWIL